MALGQQATECQSNLVAFAPHHTVNIVDKRIDDGVYSRDYRAGHSRSVERTEPQVSEFFDLNEDLKDWVLAVLNPAQHFARVDQRLFDQADDRRNVAFGKLKHRNRQPITITITSARETIEFLDDAIGIAAKLASNPIDDLLRKQILRAGHHYRFTDCGALWPVRQCRA